MSRKKKKQQQQDAPAPASGGTGKGLLGLAVLVFAMFGDVLLGGGDRVLGNGTTDLFLQFVSWREFGFAELFQGNLALWNPHIYAGAPYFGGMQAALLYPPNWLFLILPTAAAFNWSIALNTWILGALMFLWGRHRGLHIAASFLAAALLMFCGPHFLHIYAGHVTNLPAMSWAPLVFLAVDGWMDTRRPRWLLAGMAAVAMQILAGHPQYVFYTALASGFYAAVRLGLERDAFFAKATGLLSIHAGGALIAAAQLVAGVVASGETIRDEKLPWEFASMFGFPPENFLTLIAPGFFGDMVRQPYWGRCYLWEMSLFFGVVGLALSVYGMIAGITRSKAALLAVIPFALVLALGKNTPLFAVLYEYAPGFDKFRSISKFIFQAAMPMCLFAGLGLDRLLAGRTVPPRALAAVFAGALLAGIGALAVQVLPWESAMAKVPASGESYLNPALYSDPAFVKRAQSGASGGLFVAALLLAAAGALMAWMRAERRAVLALAGLAVAEVFVVARLGRDTFDASSVVVKEVRDFLAQNPGDYRIYQPVNHNSAMSIRAYDIWGFDPGVVRRYAEFLEWTQGGDPGKATQYVHLRQLHPLLALTRLKYLFIPAKEGLRVITAESPPMPRLALIGKHVVAAGREAVLEAMKDPLFDPRDTVVLESVPSPPPEPGDVPGTARVVRETTDEIEIEAEVLSPSILLMTDAWTPSWKVHPIEAPEDQGTYVVLPANHAFRAVPLAKGKHRFVMAYEPAGLAAGVWISVLASLAWGTAWWFTRRRTD